MVVTSDTVAFWMTLAPEAQFVAEVSPSYTIFLQPESGVLVLVGVAVRGSGVFVRVFVGVPGTGVPVLVGVFV